MASPVDVKDAYDKWAAQYDQEINRTRDLDAECTRNTLGSYNFSTVIELGCGTGKNTVYLLEKAERLIGIDFSDNMLDQARQKIKSDRVDFRKLDIREDWKIENRSVDLVSCSLVLEHIDDVASVIDQASRKLKPGGLFYNSQLHPYKQYWGSKARFEHDNSILEPEVFIHHLSDYLDSALENGLELVELKERFDEGVNKGIPRLINILLRKKDE